MAEPIIVSTGPLVSFARIGCLDVIGRLPYEFLCPAEVWQELDEGAPRASLGPRQPGSRRSPWSNRLLPPCWPASTWENLDPGLRHRDAQLLMTLCIVTALSYEETGAAMFASWSTEQQRRYPAWAKHSEAAPEWYG